MSISDNANINVLEPVYVRINLETTSSNGTTGMKIYAIGFTSNSIVEK